MDQGSCQGTTQSKMGEVGCTNGIQTDGTKSAIALRGTAAVQTKNLLLVVFLRKKLAGLTSRELGGIKPAPKLCKAAEMWTRQW